jgi:hypothetical protein
VINLFILHNNVKKGDSIFRLDHFNPSQNCCRHDVQSAQKMDYVIAFTVGEEEKRENEFA